MCHKEKAHGFSQIFRTTNIWRKTKENFKFTTPRKTIVKEKLLWKMEIGGFYASCIMTFKLKVLEIKDEYANCCNLIQ